MNRRNFLKSVASGIAVAAVGVGVFIAAKVKPKIILINPWASARIVDNGIDTMCEVGDSSTWLPSCQIGTSHRLMATPAPRDAMSLYGRREGM